MNKENKSKIKNNETFERFNQKNDIFNRSLWDKTVKSKKTEKFYNDYIKGRIGNKENGIDDGHPNLLGHQKLSEEIYRYINYYLNF